VKFSEFHSLEKIFPLLSHSEKVGPGDDAAVLNWNSPNLVITTDALVEGIHFNWEWSKPEDVGWKLLAVNLSDIAAMGAVARAAVVSVSVPEDGTEEQLLGVYQGLKEISLKEKTAIVGGNLSKSPKGWQFHLTLIGSLVSKPWLRSTAQVGDSIYLTGPTGLSSAGLSLLKAGSRKPERLVNSHLRPTPRTEYSEILKNISRVSAIDISDGLSSELNHLARASQKRFLIEKSSIPIEKELKEAWVYDVGEDYELILVGGQDLEKALKGTLAFKIGQVVDGAAGVFQSSQGKIQELKSQGWSH